MKADEETAKRMLEVMGRASEGWLREEDIERFPCKDLKIIDKLWVHYSQGKFGFSVQKKIWEECGSPTSYNDDWLRFCDQVGWRGPGRERGYIIDEIVKNRRFASLPWAGWASRLYWQDVEWADRLGSSVDVLRPYLVVVCLFSRAETCKL
ncbi:GUN4 domain-containing protein [Laspinema sp. D5]|nr:GUN4 domain-containing protein [Laspinema sp. D3d]